MKLSTILPLPVKLLLLIVTALISQASNTPYIVQTSKVNSIESYSGEIHASQCTELQHPHDAILIPLVPFGSFVQPNTPIFEIKSSSLKTALIKSIYDHNQNIMNFEIEKNTFAAQKELFSLGSISANKWIEANKAYNQASYNLFHSTQTLNKNLEHYHLPDSKKDELSTLPLSELYQYIDQELTAYIYAPTSGTLISENTPFKNNIHKDTVFAKIFNNDAYYIELSVDEYALNKIQLEQLAVITLLASKTKLDGHVTSINPIPKPGAKPARYSVYVAIDTENNDTTVYTFGMQTTVDIVTSTQSKVMIPISSVLYIDNKPMVKKYNPKNQVILIPVELGNTSGNYIHALSGLTIGDQIVEPN